MKCPGQDTRYWKEDAIFEVKCPHCGETVEFFKDDTSRPCPSCGKRLPNPRLDFGCAAYCPYAEQCLGSLPPELRERQQAVFKDRIEAEVLAKLKGNDEAIARLKQRLRYAEQIALEEGGKLPVVLAAACLAEIEEAETFLQELNVPREMKEEVLKTLGGDPGLEAQILKDASLLAQGEREEESYATPTGKRLAKALLS
ncbi:MAG: phosphohydrolase [Thermodesulfobacteria bacterium]|nr:phosphohydrolase [Thermodesulfobacteriota bacterium]